MQQDDGVAVQRVRAEACCGVRGLCILERRAQGDCSASSISWFEPSAVNYGIVTRLYCGPELQLQASPRHANLQ